MNEGWKVAIVQSLQCALLCISRVGTAMQNSLREQEAADSGRQSDKRSQCRANCKVCVTEHNKHPETNTRKQTIDLGQFGVNQSAPQVHSVR